MPIMQLSAMANPYAMEWDHDYLEKPLSDKFQDDIGVSNISRDKISHIEVETRGSK